MLSFFLTQTLSFVRLFLISFFLANAAFGCEVVDDSGRVIRLTQPAKRIISLAPDLTEILFAAGAGSRVVGVMRGSDYPLSAKKIPVVASYNSIDSEAILALHPDLIVAWAEEGFVPPLYKLGVPVYLSHQRKITDIPVTIKKFGCLAGTQKNADIAVRIFEKKYSELKNKYAHKKNISVFYQVWATPLITITKKSWINDVITLCGGENIFENLSGVAPVINSEAVIRANPVVIIGTGISSWEKWAELRAVKNKKLFSIDTDLIERASPRILDGAKKICELIEVAREAK